MGHIRQAVLIATVLTSGASPALAAGCMADVQQLSQRLGVTNSARPQGAVPPATTESRGIPPEVTSRLSGNSATSSNTVAARRSEALAALQSARAAAAQGNEQECSAQLGKARTIFGERQP